MSGLRAASAAEFQQLLCRIGATDSLDRFAKLGGHDCGARLPAPGQEDAAAKQAHRLNKVAQVGPRYRYGHALIVHKRTVPNLLKYNKARCTVSRMVEIPDSSKGASDG